MRTLTGVVTIVAFALAGLLFACEDDVTPTPILVEVTVTPLPTAYPTYTPAPTYTPYPTYTPVPTSTATAVLTKTPKVTPQSTYTPLPTHTPYPTTTPQSTYTPLPTHTPYPTTTPQSTYTPLPTYTPYPTTTPQSTYTPLPTYTPYPTATPTNTATPTATSTPTPTPMPLPAFTEDGIEIWGAEAMFSLLLRYNDDPAGVLRQYEGQRLAIRGALSSRHSNSVNLYWRYGTPIERNFSVECRNSDPDVYMLARLDELIKSDSYDNRSIVTVTGTVRQYYGNRDAIDTRDGGLSITVYLGDDCVVSNIVSP